MRIDIYEFETYITKGELEHKTVPTHKGYIELECDAFGIDEAEHCWELCNWLHWSEEKPSELHSEVCSCNHGICFKPEDHVWNNWLALSDGWLNGNSAEVSDYVHNHKNDIFWKKKGR